MENTQVGPFRIVKRLGNNRRQKVYHAVQVEQSRDVALKFIKFPPDIQWEVALSKIDREVDILKQLQHENLVQVYGAGVDEDRVFFATELVEGESLTAILARRGKLAPDLAVEYGRQIATALEFIHRQDIIHSKLTPDKILVTSENTVKVSDLRLNRSRRRRWDARRRRELDIAAYMAPEQFAEGATHKSDFYALGVMMYEMLTGQLPYPPDTMGRMTRNKLDSPVPSVATHVMNCPIWLDKIVTQLLDPNPRKRPHSARAIGLAFDEIKKIDKQRKAAVTQISGNFNALNAGADKTEANRLLGKKTPKKNDDAPFYQSVPFLIAALAVIAIIVGFALLPPNPQKLMSQGLELMETDRPADWREAREYFKQVMDRTNDEELLAQAEKQYYESRRRALVIQAENGKIMWTQSHHAQKFGEAVGLEQDQQAEAAKEVYHSLVDSVDPLGKDRHIYWESKRRLEELDNRQPELPEKIADLEALVRQADEAVTDEEIQSAQEILSRIILQFRDREGYEELVQYAESSLDRIERSQEAAENEEPVKQF